MRVTTALVVMTQLLIVASAPLGERSDTVAAVHVEQAGTSTHHAHGELCALCVASHLVAPPARAAVAPMVAKVAAHTAADRRVPSTAADRHDTQPRAPPA